MTAWSSWAYIYRGEIFVETGKFDISIFQKKDNKYMYIPAKSGHAKHTVIFFYQKRTQKVHKI